MKNLTFTKKIISYSKWIIALSFAGFIVSILVSYPYAASFSIPVQILAHISTIIFAGCFKVAVVALMAASKEQRVQINNREEQLCFNLKY